MQLNRRQFLRTAIGTAAASSLAACGGSPSTGGASADTLTFSVWGSDAELGSFNAVARAFEKQNAGITVKVEQLPYQQMRSTLDARLQSGQGPDLFRVTYNDIGIYSSQGVLQDLSSAIGSQSSAFDDALWAGVQFEGKPYGVPHHTDTTAVLYNKEHFAKAGIKEVPATLEEAWTWEQFLEVAEKLKAANPGGAAFGVNWQQFGAFRWFNWLWQAGGTALGADGKTPALDSPQAREALALTKSFYDKGLMPKNMLVKTNNSPDLVFPSGKISMAFVGDFLLPDLSTRVTDFEFGATFLPRGAGGAATDLGGNAVAVTTQSKNPDAAAAFAVFLASADNMKQFCEKTTVLPARKDLADRHLDYAVRPDLMPVFQQQATTMPPDLVKLVTLPGFAGVNDALVQHLEAYFAGGQSPDDTIAGLTTALKKAVAA
ncbi:ABC transporter substrate-binding protein [Nonomuraea sp. SBT364]|uniref:ABC transporter substrate-binding protein n=1 Tax=Nonomuraea sp. SBT364 TaxID=1580530 RepID=UPI00066A7710|nr:extracellular solute-binding protein [Nonomuraea sp. SBT364]